MILEFVNGSSIPARDIFQVFLKSNIAKYLPGNIMNYAGRNFLGFKLGWKNSEIAFSSLLEYIFGAGMTGLILIICMSTGLITIPPQISLNINFHKLLLYSAIAAAGAVIIISFIYIYRYFIKKEELRDTSKKLLERSRQFFTLRFLVLFVKMFLISLFCFVMNCFFYVYLCDLALGFHIKPSDIVNFNAALTIANYASIITPGVPAGLGIKESLSFLMISAYGYPKESLIVSLLVFRLVNILGDVMAFCMAMPWREKIASRSGSS